MTARHIRDDLPHLDRLNYALAAQNAGIALFLETLPFKVDRLLVAARASDWSQLRRIGNRLARRGKTLGCRELQERAEALTEVVNRPGDPAVVHRAVIRLVSICGRAKTRAMSQRQLASLSECQTMDACHGR